jgi:hypothetical protein
MKHTTQINDTNHTNQQNKPYWEEQREYFKQKTIAFKDLKEKRKIEIMKEEIKRIKK